MVAWALRDGAERGSLMPLAMVQSHARAAVCPLIDIQAVRREELSQFLLPS
jgi:hypothetical protein